MKYKVDARKLNESDKMAMKDVREMCNFVKEYSYIKGGIQCNDKIENICDFIHEQILPKSILNKYKI